MGNNRKVSAAIGVAAVLAIGALAASVWYFFIKSPSGVTKATPPIAVKPSPPIQYTLSPNVKKIDAKPLEMSANKIVFTGTKHDISTGTVLLNKDYKYCRKVNAVKIVNGKTVCTTSPASLVDTFKDLHNASFSPQFNRQAFGDIKSKVPGVSFKWVEDQKTGVDPLEIDFAGMSNVSFAVSGSAILSANPTFDPVITNGAMQGFEATYECELKGTVYIKATAAGNVTLTKHLPDIVGLPTPYFNGVLWAQPILRVESDVSGDSISNWKHTETFDIHAKTELVYDQASGWKPPYFDKDFSHKAQDSGDSVESSFLVTVIPVKVRLIYKIYPFFDTSGPADVGNDFGPYIDLISEIRCRGTHNNKGDDLFVHPIVHGSVGIEGVHGTVNDVVSALGFSKMLQPIPFKIYDELLWSKHFPASSILTRDQYATANPNRRTHEYQHHHRVHRGHYALLNDRHLNNDISIQIRDGSYILERWHDVLGLTRDDQINHVTINNSRKDIVTQGIKSISDGDQGPSDSLATTVAPHFGKLYDTGSSLLEVRNKLADGTMQKRSLHTKIQVWRRVRSYTKELRKSNRAIGALKDQYSAEKGQPSTQPSPAVNPVPPPASN